MIFLTVYYRYNKKWSWRYHRPHSLLAANSYDSTTRCWTKHQPIFTGTTNFIPKMWSRPESLVKHVVLPSATVTRILKCSFVCPVSAFMLISGTSYWNKSVNIEDINLIGKEIIKMPTISYFTYSQEINILLIAFSFIKL